MLSPRRLPLPHQSTRILCCFYRLPLPSGMESLSCLYVIFFFLFFCFNDSYAAFTCNQADGRRKTGCHYSGRDMDLKQGQQRTPSTATVGGKNLLLSATMEITTRCGVISKHNILTQVNINDTDTALPVQHTVMCVSFCRPAILLAPLLCFFPFHPADVLHLPESTWMQHYLHLPFVATFFFHLPQA